MFSGFVRESLSHPIGDLAELNVFARNRYRVQPFQKCGNRSFVNSKRDNPLVRVVPKSLENRTPFSPQLLLHVPFRADQHQKGVGFTNCHLADLCLKFRNSYSTVPQGANETRS